MNIKSLETKYVAQVKDKVGFFKIAGISFENKFVRLQIKEATGCNNGKENFRFDQITKIVEENF